MRNVADTLISTSKFNVHELRAEIQKRFGHEDQSQQLLVSCLSFGFKNGVPLDADMVFDIRFLPNPHFVPKFHDKTGLDPKVAAYVRGFPQTEEFLAKVTDLMLYLMPHYVKEAEELPHCGVRLHRRAASQRNDGRGDNPAPLKGGIPGEGCAPRHAALAQRLVCSSSSQLVMAKLNCLGSSSELVSQTTLLRAGVFWYGAGVSSTDPAL